MSYVLAAALDASVLFPILAFSEDEPTEDEESLDEEDGDDFGDDDEEEDLDGFEIEGDDGLEGGSDEE